MNFKKPRIHDALQEKLNNIDNCPLTVVEKDSRFYMHLVIDYYLKDRGNVYYINNFNEINSFYNEMCNAFTKIDSRFNKSYSINSEYNQDNLKDVFSSVKSDKKCYVIFKFKRFLPHFKNTFYLSRCLEVLSSNIRIIAMLESDYIDFFDKIAVGKKANFICSDDFSLDENDIKLLAEQQKSIIDKVQAKSLFEISKGCFIMCIMYLRLKERENLALQTVNEIICAYISQNFSAEEENLLIKAALLESFTFNELLQAVNFESSYGNEEIYDLKQALKKIVKRSFFISYNSSTKVFYVYKGLVHYAFYCLNSNKVKSGCAISIAKIAASKKHIIKAFRILSAIDMYDEIFKLSFTLSDLSYSCARSDKDLLQKVCFNMIKYVNEGNATSLFKILVEMFLIGDIAAFNKAVVMTRSNISKTAARNLRGELFLLESFASKNIMSSTVIQFRRMYEMIGGSSKVLDNISPFFGGLLNIVNLFHINQTERRVSVDEYEKIVMYINRLTDGKAKGAFEHIKGDIEYFKGNISKAKLYYMKAAESSIDDYCIKLRSICMLLKCYLMMGEVVNISKVYAEVKILFSKMESTLVEEMFELIENDIAVFLKRYEVVPEYFYSISSINKRYKHTATPQALKITGAVLLHKKEYKKLIKYCDYSLDNTGLGSSQIVLIYGHIFMATSNYNMDNVDAAKRYMFLAIEYAVQEEICLPFAEFLDYYKDLLVSFGSNPFYTRFINKVFSLYSLLKQSYDNIFTGIFTEQSKQVTHEEIKLAIARIDNKNIDNRFPCELTEIEVKCSKLAGKRYKNAEIAKELNISENTVKQALYRSFKKLGIRTRQQLFHMIDGDM